MGGNADIEVFKSHVTAFHMPNNGTLMPTSVTKFSSMAITQLDGYTGFTAPTAIFSPLFKSKAIASVVV